MIFVETKETQRDRNKKSHNYADRNPKYQFVDKVAFQHKSSGYTAKLLGEGMQEDK